jgi:RNA polymerase sigma-32 factor
MTKALTLRENNIDQYIAEIKRYPLLNAEEELALARQYRDDGDITAAHQLVISNLRFVVKIAHEYRHYGMKTLDLIQEGNMGLMMAVKKFDPDRGYRLISYAVWWIRAQIQSFVQRSWSMVKVGMTSARRKLFFKVRSERNRLEQANPELKITAKHLSEALDVRESDVEEMEVYMAGRDYSLDAPLTVDAGVSHLDMLEDDVPMTDSLLASKEEHSLVHDALSEIVESCNEKERYIIAHRLLDEEPKSLQEIGDTFSVSRERIRQLETRVLGKLKAAIESKQAERDIFHP